MRPENGEGPTVGAVAPREQSTTDTAIVSDLDASRKAYLTLQARAAINGVSLYELAGGKFLLCKFGLSRELDSLHAVAKLLAALGVRP